MKKTLSTHALTAKQIRQELKLQFPNIKFSVKSSSFAGGNAVDIIWQNGPCSESVDFYVSKFQFGNFDSMTDHYDYSNVREDISQVKYVQTSRDITETALNFYFSKFKKELNGWENLTDLHESSKDLFDAYDHCWTAGQYIYKKLFDMDLSDFE